MKWDNDVNPSWDKSDNENAVQKGNLPSISKDCCEKCKKHVRDRSFIGAGSSRRSMTGVHVECKNPSCPCHSPTSFAEIEEKFELDVWPSQGESLGSGTHFKRIKSFLRTALEKTQREAEEKEARAVAEVALEGFEKGYQAGKEDALKAKNK